MTKTDGLMKALSSVDPARVEPAPAKGSIRYDSILEAAMTTAPPLEHRSTAPHPPVISRRRGRRMAFAAAAVIVLAVATAGALQLGQQPNAAAAVRAAALNTGDTASLRATLTVRHSDGSSSSTLEEMSGTDMHIQTKQLSAGGSASTETYTVVGGKMWTTVGAKTTFQTVGPGDRLATFAGASEAVLTAALQSSEVSNLGSEEIGTSDAIHYRIVLDGKSRAVLAKLTPGELAWFELEYPDSAKQIDVWVAEKLIRRIRVRSEQSTSNTSFFDFGADISIVAPA